jgi:succinate dehydrogenase/fumarate reductase flavoprotein subunit
MGTVEPINPLSTGDGFRLALEQGATMMGTSSIKGLIRFVPPPRPSMLLRMPPFQAITRLMKWGFDRLPPKLLRPFLMRFLTTALGPSPDLFRQGAILVNARGGRFVDERKSAGISIAKQPEKVAYIIFDQATARKFSAWPYFISTAPGVAYAYLDDYRATRPDLVHVAPTLAALARQIGATPEVLETSVAAYNGDGDGLPAHEGRPRIAEPPFIALGPLKSYVVFTNGSLRVSTGLEVLDAAGMPIQGLFAAGSNGQGGMLLEGHGHHLGWAFTSGRLAGRAAALFRMETESIDQTPAVTSVDNSHRSA